MDQTTGNAANPRDDRNGEAPASPAPYSAADIVSDGCFLEPERIGLILDRLRIKKNIILQGPPGTGKTWLAKRLAFALMGSRDDSRLRVVQFHPNLSYEDFVRGWRPAGDGRVDLIDGPFMRMIATAKAVPGPHVMVIEEINRGNPAQILGEMLTLLEAGKRGPKDGLYLSHMRPDEPPVYIPENLHVIGTMNVADHSLALVDLALRRRFAFIDLEPALGPRWRAWVAGTSGMEPEVLSLIEERISGLNRVIAAAKGLGKQYRLGHSYVTPPREKRVADGREWFRQIVETEIGPLLEEYWYDDLDKAQSVKAELLQGF